MSQNKICENDICGHYQYLEFIYNFMQDSLVYDHLP